MKVDAVPEGYFRIGPYLDTAEDRAKFDRADRAHEKVLAWLKRADATPLYLTGDFRLGKSSVLNAYALPKLREAGWTVVEARAWQDPETALSEAIGKLAVARKWKLGEVRSLRERLEVWRGARIRSFCWFLTSSRNSSSSRDRISKRRSPRSSTICARDRSRASAPASAA